MQMIDVLKRLAELDAGNPNIVKENQLVPGKFYVVGSEYSGSYGGNAKAVAGPFDDEGEAEIEKAEYSQGGREDAAVAQWTGKDWNFDYMMEQGVAEGQAPTYNVIDVKTGKSVGTFRDGAGFMPGANAKAMGLKPSPTVPNGYKVDYKSIVSEHGVAEDLEECGMPGMGGMSQPHTPASINMTAASGEELSAMLKDIMTLAGQAGQDHGMDMDGDMGMPDGDGVAIPSMEPDASSSMRSMIDKLNDPDMDDSGDEEPGDDDDETKEWSNTGGDPTDIPYFDANKMSNQDPAGQPGVGDRMDGDRPKAFATTEDRLMWEYKQFIKE